MLLLPLSLLLGLAVSKGNTQGTAKSSSISGRPTSTTSTAPSVSSSCGQPVPSGSCGSVTDPYVAGYTPYLNPSWAAEVSAAAAVVTDPVLKAKASAIAKVPTFFWIDSLAKVPSL